MGALDELYDGATAEPAPATPAQETPAAPAAAPAAETSAQPAETPAATVAEPQDHSVPLNVLLRTREEFGGKLTLAEQRALAAENELAQIRRKQEEAAEQMPHPLDDPDGFGSWLLAKQKAAVDGAVGSLRQQHQQQLEAISRNMMLRHLGSEKFGELDKFIQAAPDQAHAVALKQADPYGWFFEKYEEAQKHRKAQDALKQLDTLGGKSIEEIVAERVAAELAKQTQAAPAAAAPAQAATPAAAAAERSRNSNGTFAPSTSQPQRHQPVSLAEVTGAPAIAAASQRGSALDELYPN